jgi:hypothetical protein
LFGLSTLFYLVSRQFLRFCFFQSSLLFSRKRNNRPLLRRPSNNLKARGDLREFQKYLAPTFVAANFFASIEDSATFATRHWGES